MIATVSTWRCKCGARLKVICQTPKNKQSATRVAAGPKCGDTQMVYGDTIISITVEQDEASVPQVPSWEIFDHQTKEYRDSVLPPRVRARVAVEQASTLGWERYVGTTGRVIGMHTFGASAPLKELQRKFGFEPEQVVAAAREQLLKSA